MDALLSSAHARAVLPASDYAEGATPDLLEPQHLPREQFHASDPAFAEHERLTLPDRPPLKDGSRCTHVHRFVLKPDAADRINAQLRSEAERQVSGGSFRRNGEMKSNLGGYHSLEESFSPPTPPQQEAWYSSLVDDVLLPAMRAIGGEGMGGPSAVDADGIPLEGRLTGWLNVTTGVHDCNQLHSHGQDIGWSLVYYVASGDEEPAAEAGDAAEPRWQQPLLPEQPQQQRRQPQKPQQPQQPQQQPSLGGMLLLQTKVDDAVDATGSAAAPADAEDGPTPSTQHHRHAYLPVAPRAGELWIFPGFMGHAVTPREPRGAWLPPGADFGEFLLGAVGAHPRQHLRRRHRISVACNVYMLSSPYRDALIGHVAQSEMLPHARAPPPLPPLAISPELLGGFADMLACGCATTRKPPRAAGGAPPQQPPLAAPLSLAQRERLRAQALAKDAQGHTESADDVLTRRHQILVRAQRDPDRE